MYVSSHCNIFVRILNHDSFLCKPKYRWWRGEGRMLRIMSYIRDSGLSQFLWTRIFPFNHLFKERRAQKGDQEELEKMTLESLYVVTIFAASLYLAALFLFLWETRMLRVLATKNRGRPEKVASTNFETPDLFAPPGQLCI